MNHPLATIARTTIQQRTKIEVPGLAEIIDSLVTDPNIDNIEQLLTDLIETVLQQTNYDRYDDWL